MSQVTICRSPNILEYISIISDFQQINAVEVVNRVE